MKPAFALMLVAALWFAASPARATDTPPATQWQYAVLFLNGPSKSLTLALPGKDPIDGPIGDFYKALNATEPAHNRTLNDFLNVMGNDRWELVQVENGNYYFKRPK